MKEKVDDKNGGAEFLDKTSNANLMMENYIATSFTKFEEHTCPPTLVGERRKINSYAMNCIREDKGFS